MQVPSVLSFGGAIRRAGGPRRWASVAVAVVACLLLSSQAAKAQNALQLGAIEPDLALKGKRGAAVVQARVDTLRVLQSGSACAAWFREVDGDPAGVFQTLRFTIEERGPAYVAARLEWNGNKTYKHPWGARSMQNGGRDSTIWLNASGPFFRSRSPVREQGPVRNISQIEGPRLLFVAAYSGNTDGARITILLHELGHIDGRLPEDADSWSEQSSRNSEEVLRHCRQDIQALTGKN